MRSSRRGSPRACSARPSSATARATSSSTLSPREVHDVVGAPASRAAERRARRRVIATTRPAISAARRAAAPSSSRVMCARSGSATTATAGPAPSIRRRGHRVERRVVDVLVQRAALAENVHGVANLLGRAVRPGARAGPGSPPSPSPARPTSATRPAPHGPAPRSAAVRRRMRSAGTAARPGGSTFAGSHSRSAHDSTAGSSTSACIQPSSCSQRASTTRSVDREVAHAGEEREVEQLGHLGPDLAGVGVDRVATGEHEVERAFTVERGGERLARSRACRSPRTRRRSRARRGCRRRGRVPTRSPRAACRRRRADRA